MQGKYAGAVKSLEKRIKEFLEREENRLKTATLSFLETKTSQKIKFHFENMGKADFLEQMTITHSNEKGNCLSWGIDEKAKYLKWLGITRAIMSHFATTS